MKLRHYERYYLEYHNLDVNDVYLIRTPHYTVCKLKRYCDGEEVDLNNFYGMPFRYGRYFGKYTVAFMIMTFLHLVGKLDFSEFYTLNPMVEQIVTNVQLVASIACILCVFYAFYIVYRTLWADLSSSFYESKIGSKYKDKPLKLKSDLDGFIFTGDITLEQYLNPNYGEIVIPKVTKDREVSAKHSDAFFCTYYHNGDYRMKLTRQVKDTGEILEVTDFSTDVTFRIMMNKLTFISIPLTFILLDLILPKATFLDEMTMQLIAKILSSFGDIIYNIVTIWVISAYVQYFLSRSKEKQLEKYYDYNKTLMVAMARVPSVDIPLGLYLDMEYEDTINISNLNKGQE